MRTVKCFLLTCGYPPSLEALYEVGGELVCMERGIGFTTADVKDSRETTFIVISRPESAYSGRRRPVSPLNVCSCLRDV